MAEKAKIIILASFLVVTILTAVAVVLANVGYFGPEVMQGEFARWGIGAVLAEIVGSTVLAFRWLVVPSTSMQIVFQPKSQWASNAKLVECDYEITDLRGKRLDGGEKVRIAKDRDTKQLRCFIPLPAGMKHEHQVTMKIRDDQGEERTVTDYVLSHTMEV